jgi:DNA-binding LytR/AlgR family response regulator
MPGRPSAIVVEDEPLLRRQLEELLADLWPDLDVVATAEDGEAALEALRRHRPDVMFLDIVMPGSTGIDVAREASGRCHVVFITAHSHYAVAAFEAGAVDYVLKPIDEGRLSLAVARLRERLRASAAPAPLDGLLTELAARLARARPYLRWITVARGSNVRLISVDEIAYFQSDARYTRAVTADSDSLIRTPLKELLGALDPAQFWQIHRSTIVNLSAIDAVGRNAVGHLVVRLKQRPEPLRVSQPFAHRFRQS